MIKITIFATIQAPIKDVYDSYLNAEDNRRWNTAGGGWTTGKTSINPIVGGCWSTEYISPDRKNDFVFGGTYTQIIPISKIAYAMNQKDQPIAPTDRKVEVIFEEVTNSELNSIIENDKITCVTVTFDAEDENVIDFQRAGWQAILDNFKSFIEKKLNPIFTSRVMTIDINAKRDKVWNTLFNKEMYPKWASVFKEANYYQGEISLNSIVKFVDNDGNGITSLVKVCTPNYQIVLESQTMVKDFEIDTTSDYNALLKGLKEVYTITENGEKTNLEIYYELPVEWMPVMEGSWSKAIVEIKKLAEGEA